MSDTPYLVSARKYRPQDWSEVVGQDGITQTLTQAISSGQIAQAYLFCGPRGVGKTTSARIFARAINGFAPDDDAMAFNVFELDAASNNKVEDIRSIVEQVRIPPQHGKYKVYIIDEVHMLSQSAFNAFLKTLEEPPPHAVFILATTEKHKILPTILSRCQIFDFHRITVPAMVTHLKEIAIKEGVNASEKGLHIIAVKADGALRDALSMFDQLIAFAGKKLTYEIVTEQLHVLDHDIYFEVIDYALSSNIPDTLILLDNVLARGFDAHHFLSGLGSHLRNLMVCRDNKTLSLFESTPDIKTKYAAQASSADLYFIINSLEIVNKADTQYRTSQHQRLLVELAIMKICSLKGESDSSLQLADKKKTNRLIPVGVSVEPAISVETAPEPVSEKVLALGSVPVPVPESEPVVEQALTPEPEPESVPEPAPPAPVPEPAPPAPVPAAVLPNKVKPTGLLRSKGVKLAGKSAELAETLDSTKTTNEKVVNPDWKDVPTQEKVSSAWNEFIEHQNKLNRSSLVAALKMCDAVLDGVVVTFTVKNHLHEEQLIGDRSEILYFFRENLKCAALELTIAIEKKQDVTTKFYLTDKERYEKMVEKNPLLEVLRKKLDLDLG
jgi:DNA polymerase-3 subunit gamma/tau